MCEFGKIINFDPSSKILAYNKKDELQYPMLANSYYIPTRIDEMSKYISAPMKNTKEKNSYSIQDLDLSRLS